MASKSQITYVNIVNTIDVSILELKKVKQSGLFPPILMNRISNILTFVKEINNRNFEIILHDKGIYIEKEPLDIFYNNISKIHLNNNDIERILTLLTINNSDINNDVINDIQDLLAKISMPIWESQYEINR